MKEAVRRIMAERPVLIAPVREDFIQAITRAVATQEYLDRKYQMKIGTDDDVARSR